jgi:hypothetical protein
MVSEISQQNGWDCNEIFLPAYGKRPFPQKLGGENWKAPAFITIVPLYAKPAFSVAQPPAHPAHTHTNARLMDEMFGLLL